MSEKFLNKYRIPSARWQEWDYKSPAAYFITICTHNREHYFGEIEGEEMHLSPIGKIVETEWVKTPAIRPDMNLELDEFAVMPNHFHGILIIGENEFNKAITDRLDKGIEGGDVECRDAMHGVSTNEPVPPTSTQLPSVTKNKFGPQSKNLGSVIRGFKSSVATQVKKMCGNHGGNYHGDGRDAMHGVSTTPGSMPTGTPITSPFAWQPRFHDHIIRDEESFDRIRQYIANNPLNWKEDKFYDRKYIG
jgi:REP element-mobilizing transposase RayT